MRIGVVYEKGGVGKSTLAVHLAAWLASKGSCLLIDGDPQLTASGWAAWRHEADDPPPSLGTPTTVQLLGKAIYDEGMSLQANFDNTVVDVPGKDAAGLRNALLFCDKIIIPCGNSAFDAGRLNKFLETVEQAKDFNRSLVYKLLLYKIDSRTSTKDLTNFIKEIKVPCFNSRVSQLHAFPKSTGKGLTVFEDRPKADTAIKELNQLFEELEQWA